MRSEGVLTDVHLVCKGGAKLPAHRALLAAASPQLRSMIEHLVPPPAARNIVYTCRCFSLHIRMDVCMHVL